MTKPPFTPPAISSHTSVWEAVNHAAGLRLTRKEYLADVARVRSEVGPGVAWRVDTLTTRLPDDPAWRAWQAGHEQSAFNRLDDDLPALQAALDNRIAAGIELRRLLVAPQVGGEGYAEFAFEAAKLLASIGENVRVVVDEGAGIPEVNVYGTTTYRLCATSGQIADGAVRLDTPALTHLLHYTLHALWDQARPIQGLDIRDL